MMLLDGHAANRTLLLCSCSLPQILWILENLPLAPQQIHKGTILGSYESYLSSCCLLLL